MEIEARRRRQTRKALANCLNDIIIFFIDNQREFDLNLNLKGGRRYQEREIGSKSETFYNTK